MKVLQEFTFDDFKLDIDLASKELFPFYKLCVTKLAIAEDASLEMVWGQDDKTVIPGYITDVTWKANQGDESKRTTNAMATSIDLVGIEMETGLPHQIILLIDLELSPAGELKAQWETAFCKREGAFYASKGNAYTNYRRISHLTIQPSKRTVMSGKVKLLGFNTKEDISCHRKMV